MGEEEQSVHEDEDGEVWTMKLKGLCAGSMESVREKEIILRTWCSV